MSETDYEYACMRAELLGLPKPDKEEFSMKSNDIDKIGDEFGAEEAPVDDLDVQGEQMKNVSGGLDEINSILQTTQKKINRFKAVFGSVTTLLKARVSAGESSSETSSLAGDKLDAQLPNAQTSGENSSSMQENNGTGQLPIKSPKSMDVEEMLENHVSTLDSMIYKAEDINAKMNHQTKQMRTFINK